MSYLINCRHSNLKCTGSSQNPLCASPAFTAQSSTQSAFNYLAYCRTDFLDVSPQCLSKVQFAGHLFLTAHGSVDSDAAWLAVTARHHSGPLYEHWLVVSAACLKCFAGCFRQHPRRQTTSTPLHTAKDSHPPHDNNRWQIDP